MSDYARANVYVGKYVVPSDGHVRLPNTTTVRVLRGRVEPQGWTQTLDGSGEDWLIVDDGKGFWPVMIRLNPDEPTSVGDPGPIAVSTGLFPGVLDLLRGIFKR